MRADQNNLADENFAPSFRSDSHISFRNHRQFRTVISKRNHRSYRSDRISKRQLFVGIHFEVIILCHFEERNIIIWKYHFEFVVIYHLKRTARHNTPLESVFEWGVTLFFLHSYLYKGVLCLVRRTSESYSSVRFYLASAK